MGFYIDQTNLRKTKSLHFRLNEKLLKKIEAKARAKGMIRIDKGEEKVDFSQYIRYKLEKK